MTIQQQLTEAKAAAARLAELRELERQAAMLPELEQQAEQEQQRQTAVASMKQATQEASVTLTAARAAVSEMKPRYRDLKTNLIALMAEMADVQSEINQAEETVRQAALRMARSSQHDAGVWGQIPLTEAAVNREFRSAWHNAGGFDELLSDVFDGRPDKIDLALLRLSNVNMRIAG